MRGARAWVLAHGMSWSVFIEAGIECEAIEATGDPLALRAARIARDEAGNGK